MRKVRIGLVGVMAHPFPGDKQAGFTASSRELAALSGELGFDLLTIPSGLYSREHAAAAAERLVAWGADLILIQASSFAGGDLIYPFARTGIRLALWAVSEGTVKDGPLPLNSLCVVNLYSSILGTVVRDYPHPVHWYWGPVSGDLFLPRFTNTVRALTAIANLRTARVALLGGVVPGFDNLRVDPAALSQRLGVMVGLHTFDEVKRRALACSERAVGNRVREMVAEAAHVDSGLDEALANAARSELAVREIADAGGYDAVAVACWPEFQSELNVGVCSMMGRLNASGLVAACEGDLYSAVSMLALRYMSGQPTTVMDLVDVDEGHNAALLWHCGPGPAPLADEGGLHLERHYLLSRGQGREMGVMGNLVLRSGRATVMSFAQDFSRIMVLTGQLDNRLPSFCGARGWLTDLHWGGQPISTRDLLQTIVGTHLQHHYPLVYGDFAHVSLEMAAWLGIAPLPVLPYQPYLVPPAGARLC